jgi:hypothetical protein
LLADVIFRQEPASESGPKKTVTGTDQLIGKGALYGIILVKKGEMYRPGIV